VPGVVQKHYVGSLDRNVTPEMLQGYVAGHPRAVLVGVDGLDHDCCWRAVWPRVLRELDADLARRCAARSSQPPASVADAACAPNAIP
jgi:hypothetical protein